MSSARWRGDRAGGELRFIVGPGELGVVLVARGTASDAPSGARVAVLGARAGGPAPSLGDLPQATAFLVSSGLAPATMARVRLVGGRAEIATGAAWLARAGVPMGRAVVRLDPNEAIFLDPRSGQLRVRAEARVEIVEPDVLPAPTPERAPESVARVRRHRVLVVDDSRTMRDLLVGIIACDPALEVVGTVGEPERVAQALVELRPDVVTLDIHMGAISGVDLVRQLFPRHRIPFVMISSASLSDGSYVVDALLAGAVDYIQKPALREIPTVAPLICEKLRDAATSRAAAHAPGVAVEAPRPRPTAVDMNFLVAIGSSTGGVEALREVLTNLPEHIPPIVIVQHIPAVFSRAFAERMNALCAFTVKEAEHHDAVVADQVLIAPGGMQMGLVPGEGGLRVTVVDAPPVGRHKPAVDFLFAAIAALRRPKVAAAILTGMGADGARGLLDLRRLGARTLAQDEASSVVYGMPREAAKLGAAEKVVPLQRVAETLMRFCQPR